MILPIVIFVEIKREPARSFIWYLLATKRLLLAPKIDLVDSLALKLYEIINSDPNLPSIDPPEAYALAFAKYTGLPLLTDNASPKIATAFLEELHGTEVYDSLDVLALLYSRRKLRTKIRTFIEDTGIEFSRRRLREYGLL